MEATKCRLLPPLSGTLGGMEMLREGGGETNEAKTTSLFEKKRETISPFPLKKETQNSGIFFAKHSQSITQKRVLKKNTPHDRGRENRLETSDAAEDGDGMQQKKKEGKKERREKEMFPRGGFN